MGLIFWGGLDDENLVFVGCGVGGSSSSYFIFNKFIVQTDVSFKMKWSYIMRWRHISLYKNLYENRIKLQLDLNLLTLL